MARIRSVKPELRTSLVVAEWPLEVRYFWVLLWGYLDDHGRGVDDARLMKASCLPLDDLVNPKMIHEWTDMIASSGPLCRYIVNGQRFLHAVNWSEHQKPQHPKDSVFPQCPLDHSSRQPHEVVMRDYGGPREDLTPEQVVRAGSREQAAQRSGGAEKFSGGTPEAIVVEATGATPEEARFIAERVRTEKQPRSLPGLLRTMANAGDLAAYLTDHRATARKAEIAAALAAARDGPKCEHGEPGGMNPHPASGKPLCPLCRSRAPLMALNATAQPNGSWPAWNAPTSAFRGVAAVAPIADQEEPASEDPRGTTNPEGQNTA